MRYLNWNLVMLERPTGIPFQEYSTSCSAIRDPENITQIIPSVSCTIPYKPTDFCLVLNSYETLNNAYDPLRSGGTSGPSHFRVKAYKGGVVLLDYEFTSMDPFPVFMSIAHQGPQSSTAVDLSASHHWNRLLRGNESIQLVLAEDAYYEIWTNILVFTFHRVPNQTLQAAGLAWPNLYMWTEAGSYGEQGPVCCPYMGQVHDSQARLRSWNPGGNITSQRSYAPRESEKELPQSDVGTLQTGVDREAPTLNERHQPVGREQIGNLRQSWAPSRPFVPSSRRVSQDTSMPDWPGSKSTTSSRSSSGVGLEIRQKLTGFIEHLSERNLFELAELLGQKADESHAGKAHIGSRRSSTSGAPPLLHPSVPSVVRAASYPGPLSAITRRERCGVPTAQRQPSDVSMKSQFSADSADRLEASQPAMKLPFSKSVKGRKEGFGSTNRAMFGPVATSFSAGASSVVEDKDDEPKLGASLGLRRKRARVSSDRCIETLSQPENTAPNLASMQHVGKTSPQPPAQADYMGRPTRVTFPVPLQQLRNSH